MLPDHVRERIIGLRAQVEVDFVQRAGSWPQRPVRRRRPARAHGRAGGSGAVPAAARNTTAHTLRPPTRPPVRSRLPSLPTRYQPPVSRAPRLRAPASLPPRAPVGMAPATATARRALFLAAASVACAQSPSATATSTLSGVRVHRGAPRGAAALRSGGAGGPCAARCPAADERGHGRGMSEALRGRPPVAGGRIGGTLRACACWGELPWRRRRPELAAARVA